MSELDQNSIASLEHVNRKMDADNLRVGGLPVFVDLLEKAIKSGDDCEFQRLVDALIGAELWEAQISIGALMSQVTLNKVALGSGKRKRCRR